MKRVILHVDMDAFYASIEQNDNPEYRNKPVVVGSDPENGKGRGVVSAASYEARKYGIHSAMPISKAYQLCPDAIFVNVGMRRYSEVSKQIMKILCEFSPLVEQISVDEAFVDCSGCKKLFGEPDEIAQKIKNKIKNDTGLTASIGIASNKSIAKIASDLDKPDGITICEEGKEEKFLKDLNVSHLWGAGKKTVNYLNSYGFYKIGDIAKRTKQEMESILGKNGIHLWFLSKGIDIRPVLSDIESYKSVSREFTFKEDTNDYELIKVIIKNICDTITREIRLDDLYAKTVSIKLRFTDFSTFTRNFSFLAGENNFIIIRDVALSLFDNFDKKNKKIRLIGVGVSNFVINKNRNKQLDLFSNNQHVKTEKQDKVLDNLKKKYGKKITRATFLK